MKRDSGEEGGGEEDGGEESTDAARLSKALQELGTLAVRLEPGYKLAAAPRLEKIFRVFKSEGMPAGGLARRPKGKHRVKRHHM